MSISNDFTVGIFFDGPLLPPTEGASNRIYNLSKYLALDQIETKFFKCHRECNEIAKFKRESLSSGIDFFLISPDLFFKDFKVIEDLIVEENVKIVQMKDPELILTLGLYIKKRLGVLVCFDSHDVTHVLMQRLGYSQFDISLTKFKELAANHYSDLHTCVSHVDEDEFAEIGCNEEKMKIVENGVDTRVINYVGPNYYSNTVLFLGNMFYYPNTYAVEIICEKIVPKVTKKRNDIKFLFVGACPPKIAEKYRKTVQFVGPVEDLNIYFRKATIALAPLFHGSGTRIKILHYFAAGIPVISTRLGIEGLEGIVNKTNIIIEDDIKKYSDLILWMINNIEDYTGITVNARKLVEERYDWKTIAARLGKIYSVMFDNALNK